MIARCTNCDTPIIGERAGDTLPRCAGCPEATVLEAIAHCHRLASELSREATDLEREAREILADSARAIAAPIAVELVRRAELNRKHIDSLCRRVADLRRTYPNVHVPLGTGGQVS